MENEGTVTPEDFFRIKFKVGRVISAERHPNPKVTKLLILKVDVGETEPRQILAGIALKYSPEQMVDRKVVVVCNLPVRKMQGYESNGMLLAASNAADELVGLVSTEALPGVEIGPGDVIG